MRVEKQITAKTKTQLKQREADIKQLREQFVLTEGNLRSQLNEVSLKDAEQTQAIGELTLEKKKLKLHKNMLKEEVLRQRRQIEA